MSSPFACERLGEFVAASRCDDLPQALRHEGKRSLLNFIGCALGVAQSPPIEMALRVAGVGRGDEVLSPSLTFVATNNAIAHLGAVPHFVDSEATTLGTAAMSAVTVAR